MRAAFVAVLLPLLSFAQAKPAPEPVCRVDSDCTMTDWTGCCRGCCPAPKHAMGVKELQSAQYRCAVVDCPVKKCQAVRCMQQHLEPEQVAVCRHEVCVEETAQAECRADGDCELVPAPSTGCCSTQWLARPLEKLHIMEDGEPTAPAQKKKDEPKFGLSTGSGRPGCGTCPSLPPARAACQSARCVVQPIKR